VAASFNGECSSKRGGCHVDGNPMPTNSSPFPRRRITIHEQQP
jgi:hypothetical protein